jgi:hypothetical protein
MRFDDIKFYPQFYFWKPVQTGISIDHSKFCTLFQLFYQNSVDFFQTNFTGNLLCIRTTYSEKPEGVR